MASAYAIEKATLSKKHSIKGADQMQSIEGTLSRNSILQRSIPQWSLYQSPSIKGNILP